MSKRKPKPTLVESDARAEAEAMARDFGGRCGYCGQSTPPADGIVNGAPVHRRCHTENTLSDDDCPGPWGDL